MLRFILSIVLQVADLLVRLALLVLLLLLVVVMVCFIFEQDS